MEGEEEGRKERGERKEVEEWDKCSRLIMPCFKWYKTNRNY